MTFETEIELAAPSPSCSSSTGMFSQDDDGLASMSLITTFLPLGLGIGPSNGLHINDNGSQYIP